MKTLLEISDLSVSYGAIHALEDLNLVVHAGEIVTLIGANGAGKTTTLRTISSSCLTPAAGVLGSLCSSGTLC